MMLTIIYYVGDQFRRVAQYQKLLGDGDMIPSDGYFCEVNSTLIMHTSKGIILLMVIYENIKTKSFFTQSRLLNELSW